MGQPKLNEQQRRAIIINAGLVVARGPGGIASLNFDAIAKQTEADDAVLNTSAHVVKYWFRTRDALWAAVIDADDTGELRKQADTMGWVVPE